MIDVDNLTIAEAEQIMARMTGIKGRVEARALPVQSPAPPRPASMSAKTS